MTNQVSTNLFHTNRSILKANRDAAILGKENMDGKKSIENLKAADIISLGINYSAKSTFDGIVNSIEHGLEYLSPIQSSLLEMQRLYQAGLDIATQAATNPNMRGPQASAVNQELRSIIDDAQRTVETTRDAAGKIILDGTLLPHHKDASGSIQNIKIKDDVMQADNASIANDRLKAIDELGLNDNTKRLLDKMADKAVQQHGSGVVGTVDYLMNAMKVIPNIAIDTSSMIFECQNAQRASNIGAKLSKAIESALKATENVVSTVAPQHRIALAQKLVKANIVSALINESVNISGGHTAKACEEALGNAAEIRGLLTPGEILSLKEYIKSASDATATSVGVGDVGDGVQISAIHNQELSKILQNISCFRNIGGLLSTDDGKSLYGESIDVDEDPVDGGDSQNMMTNMLGIVFDNDLGGAGDLNEAKTRVYSRMIEAVCGSAIINLGKGAVVTATLKGIEALDRGIAEYEDTHAGALFDLDDYRDSILGALNDLIGRGAEANIDDALANLIDDGGHGVLYNAGVRGQQANRGIVDIDNIFNENTIGTITTYAIDSVNTKIQNAKPHEIRIGTAENDKLSLSINDISPAAVGIEGISVLDEENALDAVESLTLAVQQVSNALISLSNQSKHLKSQLEVVNSSRDVILEAIADIQNVDPVVNAKELSRLHNTTKSAGFTIGLEQAFENSLQETANSILRRAVAAAGA